MSTSRAGPSAAFALTLAAIAAIVFWPRRSSASVNPLPYPQPQTEFDPYPYPLIWSYGDLPMIETPTVNDDRNLRAFLYMIRAAEHEPRFSDGERYGLFYSSIPFTDYSDHPAITGEVQPVRLPDRFCKPAGFNPPCYSTAAGAYQIIRPTWQRVRAAGSWGPRLPDFSPASQDEAARRLLIEARALPLIERGEIAEAIGKVSRIWASLPGSTAQQGAHSLSHVLNLYSDGLWVA